MNALLNSATHGWIVGRFAPAMLGSVLFLTGFAAAQTPGAAKSEAAVLINVVGKVEHLPAGGSSWSEAKPNQPLRIGDSLRTGKNSRAELRMADGNIQRYFELTTLRIDTPAPPGGPAIPNLRRGSSYHFHRDRASQSRFGTPRVSGSIRGTEFHLAVAEDGTTVVTLLDGEIDLENEQGKLNLQTGEEARVEPGKAPAKTAVINAVNTIQWCLYYPGIVDPAELELGEAANAALADSLAAYRSGDLLAALAKYPANRIPATDMERVYRAAVLLAVGQVAEAEALLKGTSGEGNKAAQLAGALQRLIATVKSTDRSDSQLPTLNPQPSLATEWLAESYCRQAGSKLTGALQAARAAAAKSSEFGFAWARVAELEFSFGRTKEASVALERALALAPRNAQALALKGFLLAAQGQAHAALDWFNQAIAIDGALANAWLGRGLVRIRKGDWKGGREDLQMAAAMEPQRAFLRSYLGKAFGETGERQLALRELELARRLDPNDPTAWLYSALLHQQNNQINAAVRDLEKSQELNDNRSVYRSSLLLDQDRAVRSANLASIYRDAGMTEVGFHEATHAVRTDYANYSAHLFLANSYADLQESYKISRRYEMPAIMEYLTANLLAPVGARSLSRNVSQQEYSKLFEADRLGGVVTTDYSSYGNWTQTGTLYGNTGRIGYALDSTYQTENGFRPNQDLEQRTFSAQVKLQVTPQDSFYSQIVHMEGEFGDLVQYYDQNSANPAIRIKEKQEPLLVAGFAHEWRPGMRSLFLVGRLQDRGLITNPNDPIWVGEFAGGIFVPRALTSDTLNYRNELEIYTAEGQHVLQGARHSLVLGGGFQTGVFRTQSRQLALQAGAALAAAFPNPAVVSDQNSVNDFDRYSGYGYYQLNIVDPLALTVGVSYDRVHYPDNFRSVPINSLEAIKDQWSPKGGLVWKPGKNTTVRGAYTRSLGGVSFEQDFRLEPTQIAGFNQAFRSLAPESVATSAAAPQFETWGVGIDHKFGTGTYAGVEGELLNSDQNRVFSAYSITTAFFGLPVPGSATQADLRENQYYEEKNLTAYVNQLLGEDWTLGARYRLSDANLAFRYAQAPAYNRDFEATLQQLNLFALYNHRGGFFARGESLCTTQSNRAQSPAGPGDSFWHFNLFLGYRLPRRAAQFQVGILNLTDRDYQLNPVSLYAELPHERTFVASVKLNF